MKSFKEFIKESPQINTYLKKPIMDKIRNQYSEKIVKNHNDAEKIDNNSNYYKLKDKDSIHYYRTDSNNTPIEISSFDKNNTQRHVSKGDGSSEHNINFMYAHANDHGEVKSDSSNTEGSKNLWKRIIKNPKPEFSVYHNYKGNENKVDSDYLNKNEDIIWNRSSDAFDHKLILRKDK